MRRFIQLSSWRFRIAAFALVVLAAALLLLLSVRKQRQPSGFVVSGVPIEQWVEIMTRNSSEAIDEIRGKGTTILLVEQNAHAALGHSDRAYVLETGRIVMEGASKDLAADPRIKEAYLGE